VKNDVWRRGRRFAEQHDLAFDDDAEPDDRGMAALFELSRLRWDTKDRPMVGLFAGTAGREFLADVVPALRAEGRARLSLVHADGAAVAARLGFEVGDTYLGYKECFDPSIKALGPGQYLTSRVLHAIDDRGLREFDFLRGEGAHKSKWANGERVVGYWTMHAGGSRGRVAERLMWWQLRRRQRGWAD
jgi:CelD/BcsL family acetyltransferase involved in cellulose biosynthesis